MTALATISTALAGIPWKKIGAWLTSSKLWLLAVLKPFGAWGILGLSLVDSAIFPLIFLDPLVVSYGVASPPKVVLYCFMGALGSSIGSMLPYYIGRAGGELFLLKRINRERYEKLRDRFERQEFLAIMLPAMCPPPMPVKVVELAAGVLEMKPLSYFFAVLSGKFLRFFIESMLVIIYGPAILTTATHVIHRHATVFIGVVLALLLLLSVYIVRKIFDRRKGVQLPVEDTAASIAITSDDSL